MDLAFAFESFPDICFHLNFQMDAFFISLCELLICIDSIEKSIFTFSKYVPFFNHRNQKALKKANKLKKVISSKRLNKFQELVTIVQQSVGGLAEFLSVKQEDIYIDKYLQNQRRLKNSFFLKNSPLALKTA